MRYMPYFTHTHALHALLHARCACTRDLKRRKQPQSGRRYEGSIKALLRLYTRTHLAIALQTYPARSNLHKVKENIHIPGWQIRKAVHRRFGGLHLPPAPPCFA